MLEPEAWLHASRGARISQYAVRTAPPSGVGRESDGDVGLAVSLLIAMSNATAVEVAREFWRLMASNDFYSVAEVLAPAFVLEWPQSNERIRGSERFARVNQEYPAHGRWLFTVNRIVGGESEAVSDVTVTDGVQTARVISFFTVAEGKVTRLVEFWPEPYAGPVNRAHLVEAME